MGVLIPSEDSIIESIKLNSFGFSLILQEGSVLFAISYLWSKVESLAFSGIGATLKLKNGSVIVYRFRGNVDDFQRTLHSPVEHSNR